MPPKTLGEFHETPTFPQLCRQAARTAKRGRVSAALNRDSDEARPYLDSRNL